MNNNTRADKLRPITLLPALFEELVALGQIAAGIPLETIEDRQRAHLAMDLINQRYGPMALASARLLRRSTMPDVTSPAWKPCGHRKTV